VTEEKEPKEWGEFFSGTMGKLKSMLDKRKDDRLLAQMTPEKRLIELRADIARGQRTRNFLDGAFWKEDLEPFLRNEAKLKPWVPGDPLPLEQVSTLHLWNSGKVYILTMIVKQMGKWVEAENEAHRIIVADNEKRKALHKK
jgi:hypothetical protein